MLFMIEGATALADDLDTSASWRREKAAEHPKDSRNLTAAELLESLAAELRGGANADELRTVQEALGEYLEACDRSKRWVDGLSEQMGEYMRSIGFHRFPSVSELLGDLRLLLQEAAAAHAEEGDAGYGEASTILCKLVEDGVIAGHGAIVCTGYGGRNDAKHVTIHAPPFVDVVKVEAAVKAALGPTWHVTVAEPKRSA